VKARLTSGPSRESFGLHIEDGFGRTSDRVLSETGTAVSLIESWAVDEDSDLLGNVQADTSVARDDERSAVVTAATAPLWHLYGGAGGLTGSDRSVWASGVVRGCVRVGPMCLGAELSAGHDLGLEGDTAEAGTTRWGADLLAIGALPIVHAPWLIMPALGLGAGWMGTRVVTDDPDSPVETSNTVGLRGELSLLVGVSLSRALGLALDFSALAAPGARQSSVDPSANSNLPGEPRFAARATLGCVVTP
jgi:hypothetical protein